MTEVAYIIAAVAVMVGALWLWRRYGKEVAITAAIGLAIMTGAIEALLWSKRRQARKEAEDMDPRPSPSDERLRRQLAEALKSGQQRLDEARKDGTSALKDELRRSRLEREGPDEWEG